MKDTDVEYSHEEVGDDPYAVSLPLFGLRGRPVESVKDVLAKRREQPVGYLNRDGK